MKNLKSKFYTQLSTCSETLLFILNFFYKDDIIIVMSRVRVLYIEHSWPVQYFAH